MPPLSAQMVNEKLGAAPRRKPGPSRWWLGAPLQSAGPRLSPGCGSRYAEIARQVANDFMKSGAVYIMTNKRLGTLYTGVTSDLLARVFAHREGLVAGFTRKYRCKRLVWYEAHDDLQVARRRELQIKEWRRAWKIELIERGNPDWEDLYYSLR